MQPRLLRTTPTGSSPCTTLTRRVLLRAVRRHSGARQRIQQCRSLRAGRQSLCDTRLPDRHCCASFQQGACSFFFASLHLHFFSYHFSMRREPSFEGRVNCLHQRHTIFLPQRRSLLFADALQAAKGVLRFYLHLLRNEGFLSQFLKTARCSMLFQLRTPLTFVCCKHPRFCMVAVQMVCLHEGAHHIAEVSW